MFEALISPLKSCQIQSAAGESAASSHVSFVPLAVHYQHEKMPFLRISGAFLSGSGSVRPRAAECMKSKHIFRYFFLLSLLGCWLCDI